MPIATIELSEACAPEACTPEARARLAGAVARAIGGVTGAAPESVAVILRDGAAAQPDAARRVRAYLEAMEARDLPAARALLAPGFAMTFPGGITMTTLEDLIAWSAPRYRFVRKTYARFDALGGVVYCFGTLAGEWPDGTPFAGIRFIDRFELEGGLITRQDVWNDMGEVRGARE